MATYNPTEARSKKNSLLEALKNNTKLIYTDFTIEELTEPNFPKWKIYKKLKPNYYFLFQEVVPHFSGEYFPQLEGYEKKSFQYSKAVPEKGWLACQHEFRSWMAAMVGEENELKREKALHDAMNPVTIYDEEELSKPFTLQQKFVFEGAIDEMILKTTYSKILSDVRKKMIIDIAIISKEELRRIATLEPGEQVPSNVEGEITPDYETKESFLNRLKARLNKVMGKVKDFSKEVIYDLAKDTAKDWIKDIIKTMLIGTLAAIGYNATQSNASVGEKIEIYNITTSSFHFTMEAPIQIKNQFYLSDSTQKQLDDIKQKINAMKQNEDSASFGNNLDRKRLTQ